MLQFYRVKISNFRTLGMKKEGPCKRAYIEANQRLLRRLRSTLDTLLTLVYCGSCTAAKAAKYIAAAVNEPQYTRDKIYLCTAAAAAYRGR